MPEYVVVAHNPDQVTVGDHLAKDREDAIDYASHFLDEEERTGASIVVTVVNPNMDEDLAVRDGSDAE